MTDATANRGYRYPLSTDGPQIYDWFQDLAGDVDADVQDIVTTLLTPVTDSSMGTPAAGFIDAGCYVRTILGKVIMVKLLLTNASGITASGGDFTDVTAFQVDPAYCPTDTVNGAFGNGHVSGEGTLASDGTVLIRSASDSIGAGTSCRLTFTFIKI